MDGAGARLEIRSPVGVESTVPLRAASQVIGRPVPGHRPEVPLEPDPARYVGRSHATVEFRGGRWVLVDGGTVNGTVLHRAGVFHRLEDEIWLADADEILVLADVGPTGEPVYWRLIFRDPQATRRGRLAAVTAPATPDDPPSLEYEWSAARVYRWADGVRTEITDLRPRAHELVRHMAARAAELRSPVVVCTHDELLQALFGDRSTWSYDRAHTEQDIREVVSDVRKAVEPDRAHPVILQTVRGMGYRLVARLEPEV